MDTIKATAKVSTGLKDVKLRKKMIRIYDLYENNIFTNNIRRYIDYKVKNTFRRININLITFKKRVYNQYKYAIILTYKTITTK